MEIGLPTTAYVLLGLLAQRPMAGHELSSLADHSVAYFWPVPRSQVYRELPRLERLGYLRGRHVEQTDAPDKRVYEVTDAGRAALHTWLNEPTYQRSRVKNGLLVKVYLAREMAPERLAGLLADHRVDVEAYLTDLQAIDDRLAAVAGTWHSRATVRYGIHQSRAVLAWLDEIEREVAERVGEGGPR